MATFCMVANPPAEKFRLFQFVGALTRIIQSGRISRHRPDQFKKSPVSVRADGCWSGGCGLNHRILRLDMPPPIPRHDESFRRPHRCLAVGLIMMISAARRFRSTLQSSYPNGAARTAENKAVIFFSVDNRMDFSLYEKLCHRFRAFHWISGLLICAPWVCSVWQIFTKRELSGFSGKPHQE